MGLINILKNKKSIRKLAIGALFSLVLTNTSAQNRSIEFHKGNWGEVKEKAKQSNKIIFMDCYTTWCRPCKVMDKNVFTNDSVADFYNKNFVNMKMDIESDSGKVIKKLYDITFYPTFLYTDDKGKLLHKEAGGRKSDRFISLGKTALNPEKRLATFNEKYEKGKRDNKFIYDYLKILKNASINSKEISDNYFEKQKEEDLTSRINWNILFINGYKTDINSKTFKYLIENKEKFDGIYTSDSVDNKIFEAYYYDFSKILYKKSFDFKSYEEWKSKVKEQNFSRVDEVLLESDLKYNRKIKNWDAYASNAVLLAKIYNKNYDAGKLNGLVWKFYENINDKSLLEKAVGWAKQSLELESKAYNNDTYAVLLYKLGKVKQAIKFEEKAIGLAKEKGRKSLTEYFEKKLSKMQLGEKLY